MQGMRNVPPEPHGVSKLLRTAAMIVATEILVGDGLKEKDAIQAVAECTGVEAPLITVLATARDTDPLPRLRAALMEDVRAIEDLTNSVETAFWVLHRVWRDTPDLTDFGNAQPNAEALIGHLRECMS